MNNKLLELRDKYSRDKWPMYSSFYIVRGRLSGKLLISERVYSSYDKPDWYDFEYLTEEEASWMNANSDVKFRWGVKIGTT